jgi:diketogulonate reductase-like aldo/keto reductase
VGAAQPAGAAPPLPHAAARALAAAAPSLPPRTQVLLRWGLQQGCCVIPKSVRPDRIREFAPAALLEGWELSAQQMAALGALDRGTKFCWDPSGIL